MVTAQMVGLDARNEQPQVCSTFTTRDHVTPSLLREAMAQIVRLVRSECGPARYCSFVEFTTGRGPRAGGVRRPHLHALWKDVDPEAAPVVAGVAAHVLERMAGAWRHDVQEIRTPAGAAMYVASHHLKESQSPPAEWGPPEARATITGLLVGTGACTPGESHGTRPFQAPAGTTYGGKFGEAG